MGLIISIVISTIVSILWVRGIDKQDPDYKGYDLFDEDDKNSII